MDFIELWYSMMANMFSGILLEVMIVVTPAAVAISAAMSFVSIPPVPRLDPRVVVLTVGCQGNDRVKQIKVPSPWDRIAAIEVTLSICLAAGSFRGFEVYSPSTSVSRKR